MEDEMNARDALAANMVKIENVSVEPLTTSAYIKPFRMHFAQNSIKRHWDFVKLLDSVVVLIYNRTRHVLIFVKQFRPAVYFKSAVHSVVTDFNAVDWSRIPGSNGVTLELCAGLMDKNGLSAEQTAKEEVLEECGYEVPLENFELITKLPDVGETSTEIFMFYVEVEDNMKVNEGGGNSHEGEFIEVVEMTIPEITEYINKKQLQSPSTFAFAVMWFLHQKWCSKPGSSHK